MSEQHSRRQILQGMGAACATFLLERKGITGGANKSTRCRR